MSRACCSRAQCRARGRSPCGWRSGRASTAHSSVAHRICAPGDSGRARGAVCRRGRHTTAPRLRDSRGGRPFAERRVLGFTLAAGVGSGLPFGLAPSAPAEHDRGPAGPWHGRERRPGNVAARRVRHPEDCHQPGVLVGAGLFLRTLENAYSVDLGYQVENTLVALSTSMRAAISKAARGAPGWSGRGPTGAVAGRVAARRGCRGGRADDGSQRRRAVNRGQHGRASHRAGQQQRARRSRQRRQPPLLRDDGYSGPAWTRVRCVRWSTRRR